MTAPCSVVPMPRSIYPEKRRLLRPLQSLWVKLGALLSAILVVENPATSSGRAAMAGKPLEVPACVGRKDPSVALPGYRAVKAFASEGSWGICHVSRVVPRRVASHGCAADAESCGARVSGALASGAGHTQTSPPEKLPKDRVWFCEAGLLPASVCSRVRTLWLIQSELHVASGN